MFNAIKTGTSYALFSTWESGRTWPFVPSWMEKVLPPPMDINGPTVAWVLQILEVLRDEKVSDFLQRMSREQDTVRRNQHAPWDQVLKELKEESSIAVDASYRQSFVWDMTIGLWNSKAIQDDFEVLKPVGRFDWADW